MPTYEVLEWLVRINLKKINDSSDEEEDEDDEVEGGEGDGEMNKAVEQKKRRGHNG